MMTLFEILAIVFIPLFLIVTIYQYLGHRLYKTRIYNPAVKEGNIILNNFHKTNNVDYYGKKNKNNLISLFYNTHFTKYIQDDPSYSELFIKQLMQTINSYIRKDDYKTAFFVLVHLVKYINKNNENI